LFKIRSHARPTRRVLGSPFTARFKGRDRIRRRGFLGYSRFDDCSSDKSFFARGSHAERQRDRHAVCLIRRFVPACQGCLRILTASRFMLLTVCTLEGTTHLREEGCEEDERRMRGGRKVQQQKKHGLSLPRLFFFLVGLIFNDSPPLSLYWNASTSGPDRRRRGQRREPDTHDPEQKRRSRKRSV